MAPVPHVGEAGGFAQDVRLLLDPFPDDVLLSGPTSSFRFPLALAFPLTLRGRTDVAEQLETLTVKLVTLISE
jgi:hypothetical protein